MSTTKAVICVLFVYFVISLGFAVNAKEQPTTPTYDLRACSAAQFVAKSKTASYYNQLLLIEGELPLTYFMLGKVVGMLGEIAIQHGKPKEALANEILAVCDKEGVGAL